MKNKICIVSAGGLPIPDVKGGAVERLITMIVEDNEKYQRFQIDVITCYDEVAILKQKSFKYARFVNIKIKDNAKICSFLHKIQWHMLNWFHLDFSWIYYISSSINRYLVKNAKQYDMIVGECAGVDFCSTASIFYGRDKFCVHLHGNVVANSEYENTYGNVISVSDFIMHQYRTNSKLPYYRTATVFNGIATEHFEKKMSSEENFLLRKQLGLSDKDFVLIFCGRIVPDKGVKELMEAVVAINNPNIKLMIMGASNFGLGDFGEYPKQVKQLVEKYSDNIIFTGFVNNAELYKYHQIANVGVVPSMHNDPCPLSLFEFITSGLPTIATNAGGIPEIGTKETTLFVNMESMVTDLIKAINKLYNEPSLIQKMKDAAVKRREYFNRVRFYNDFCDTIEGMINLNKKNK